MESLLISALHIYEFSTSKDTFESKISGIGISYRFTTVALSVVVDRIIRCNSCATVTALNCQTIVQPVVSAALSLLALVLSTSNKTRVIKISGSLVPSFISYCEPIGSRRIFSRILDTWQYVLLGKNTLHCLTAGISISSSAVSIIQFLMVFGKTKRHAKSLLTNLSSYVYDNVAPKLLDHFQLLECGQSNVASTLTNHLTGLPLQMTTDEASLACLWLSSVIGVLYTITWNLLNLKLLNSSVKLSFRLYIFLNYFSSLGFLSKRCSFSILRCFFEFGWFRIIYLWTFEDLSSLLMGTNSMAYIYRQTQPYNKWKSPVSYFPTYINWKIQIIKDYSHQWLDFKTRCFKKELKIVKNSIINPFSSVSNLNADNSQGYIRNTEGSRFPLQRNWWLLINLTTSMKKQQCGETELLNTKLKYIRKLMRARWKIKMFLHVAKLQLTLEKDRADSFVTLFVQLHTTEHGIEVRKTESFKVCSMLLIWQYFENIQLRFSILINNQITNKIINRYIPYHCADSSTSSDLLPMLRRCISTFIRIFGILSGEDLIPHLLKLMSKLDSCFAGNNKDLNLADSLCATMENQSSKKCSVLDGVSYIKAMSIVRSALFKLTINYSTQSAIFLSAESFKKETSTRYRNLVSTCTKSFWKEIVEMSPNFSIKKLNE
jgi:hypothetical protein